MGNTCLRFALAREAPRVRGTRVTKWAGWHVDLDLHVSSIEVFRKNMSSELDMPPVK